MFTFLEVHKIDVDLDWIEFAAADEDHPDPAVIRLVIDEGRRMVHAFEQRYMAKREHPFEPPDGQMRQLEDFFEEARMAKAFYHSGSGSLDLVELLPTNTLYFDQPERTSFRKSRAGRVRMFLDEAQSALQRREFDRTMHRLGWALLLDPDNEEAFELKIICLRSWKKMAECIPVFEAWIAAHPQRIEPRLGLSEMWLYLEQNQRAKDAFQDLLEVAPNEPLAMIGLAQAKTKLGEDPCNELRKAWVLDSSLTIEMVEKVFDFRRLAPDDLEPRSLIDISEQLHIPLQRVIARARTGALPLHPPAAGSDLMRASPKDLDRHYHALRILGLEIAPSGQGPGSAAATQSDLFKMGDEAEQAAAPSETPEAPSDKTAAAAAPSAEETAQAPDDRQESAQGAIQASLFDDEEP